MSNYTDNQASQNPNHAWNRILKIVPKNALLLDIGCSSGNLGKELIQKSSCTVDGIEIDEADAKIAATKLRKVYVFDINQTSNFKTLKDRYDILIFADVLEHLPDPVEVLQASKHLLKSNGSIVFSIPNMAHISIRLALLQGQFDHTDTGLIDKTHLHFYTEKEVRRIFSDSGLTVGDLDASSYPYPEMLIKEKLQNIGLTASEKALAMLQQPDANAFQFVGVASPSPRSQPKSLAPPQPFQTDMQETVNILHAKENELQKTYATIKEQQEHIQNLSQQLENIKNSRAFKVYRSLVQPYKKVRRGKKNQ